MSFSQQFKRFSALSIVVGFAVVSVSSSPAHAQVKPDTSKMPWMNKALSPDERADLVLGQMTLDEKIQMVHGTGWGVLRPPDPVPAKSNFAAADLECMDVEAVLEFASRLVERPKQLWLESSLEQKQRLQGVFFPDGVNYTSEGFGTAVSNSFFNVFREIVGEKVSLASPTGFEPVLSP